jgi:hypothetical protein
MGLLYKIKNKTQDVFDCLFNIENKNNKINAFIVNRNLLTTLKNTVDFLKKNNRINIIILDQESSYSPLLDYYKTIENEITIIYSTNDGPWSLWSDKYNSIRNDNYFILTDPDCLYDGVPDDWLDKMLFALQNSDTFKVGFSLELIDLPKCDLSTKIINWERQFWHHKNSYGWSASIDTTFALYRPNSGFSYNATRLDRPYTIKHVMWYLNNDNIDDEWRYYLEHASGTSSWGNKQKNNGILNK